MKNHARRTDRPAPPINGTNADIAAWLNDPAVNAPALAEDIRFSVVLSAANLPSGREDIDQLWNGVVHLSWLGGPAVGPLLQWPQHDDGTPLSHVASLNLGEVADVVEDKHRLRWGTGMPDRYDPLQSLPDYGVLEIFHDCETYGYEQSDRASGAWQVRWVAEPNGSITEPPDDADPPTAVCQVVIPYSSFSIRSPEDAISLSEDEFDRVELANNLILDAWQSFHTAGRHKVYTPVSHLYGHSWKGTEGIQQKLNRFLPLVPGDDHLLLVDLETWTHLDGWFGDAGHLEVWIRRSDLAARDFDKAWCFIRLG